MKYQTFFKISSFLRTGIQLFLIAILIASCGSTKSGCPANDNATVKTDKKGNLSSKRGKSSLFPKDARKKIGIH